LQRQVDFAFNTLVVETRFIEHLIAYRSEYDELREFALEFKGRSQAKLEKLFDRLVERTELPDFLDDYAYAYVFEGYDPLPENE
jgi:hypothetical protein